MKVYIRKELYGEGIDIAFVENRDGKRFIVKPMRMELQEIGDGGIEEPSLRISHHIAPDFLKALAEALDEAGIKTENDFKLQGILEATKKHLADMRKLVFKTS